VSTQVAEVSEAGNKVLLLLELTELKKVFFIPYVERDDLIRPCYKPSDYSYVYVYFGSLFIFFARRRE